MQLKERSVFLASPGGGTLVYGNSFYTRAAGLEKMRTRHVETRSDLIDSEEIGFSQDNGRSWSAWEKREVVFKQAGGTRRIWRMPGVADGERLVTIVLEGVLPGDDAMDGLKHYYLRCQVSKDGGRTSVTDEVICGPGFTAEHPFAGVWVGKNSIMMGDLGSRPIRTRGGRILVPAQVTPLGPDGEYYNPGGGYTFHEAAVLIGQWREDERLSWRMGPTVKIDPARSTRGAIEPTLAQMGDGRILMVIRGSNGGTKDTEHQIPSYRWHAVSADEGETWTEPVPWTYAENGKAFYSPSSCSQLLPHSNGKCYWLGNICKENAQANSPRYPFVIGRVDQESLQLMEASVTKIDDRGEGEDASLTLSNFMAHEDRKSGGVIVHMSRFVPATWTGDAYIYRIAVE